MDSFGLLVVNGLVVTASDTAHYDIAVKNGKIVLLAPPGVLPKEKASRVIDAEGGYVMVQTFPSLANRS
jgi:dihydropyrimidinase